MHDRLAIRGAGSCFHGPGQCTLYRILYGILFSLPIATRFAVRQVRSRWSERPSLVAILGRLTLLLVYIQSAFRADHGNSVTEGTVSKSTDVGDDDLQSMWSRCDCL